MDTLRHIYTANRKAGAPVISFEFFPPKTEDGEQSFFAKTLPALAELKPDYCSVTYGAGGSTRGKTLEIVDRIQREHGLTSLAHLTCIGSTREELREVAEQALGLGIQNILALRGDPPPGAVGWTKPEGGLEYAYQLVQLLKAQGDFSVAVAGFPEGHTDCREGKLADWDHLREKIECGADAVITQLFFDNRDYFALRDHLESKGIDVPIVPGIIPILSGSQIKKFTALCGAKIPPVLLGRLDELGDNTEAVTEFGIDYATQQCRELLAAGAPGLHFYTLNRARSTSRILLQLGVRTR
jgi:methylenetetrahydrofolate reductase (NADPH)